MSPHSNLPHSNVCSCRIPTHNDNCWHPALGTASLNDWNLSTSAMINPSKTADAQDDCILFKLAAETRNQIYELVFTIKLKEDGSVELDDTIANNALTRTCQQIYNSASHDHPSNTFTLDVPDRKRGLSVPRLGNAFFQRMTSFRVTWRADERNKGKPLRFTSHFHNKSLHKSQWSVRVELHDEYWRGKEAGDKIARVCAKVGQIVMNGWRGERFASWISHSIRPKPAEEERIWVGQDVKMRMPRCSGALW
jgi:hypothetical protein